MRFFWVGHFEFVIWKNKLLYPNEKKNPIHIRSRLFLQYGWFPQNLGKDFIKTNMHTTVSESRHVILDVVRNCLLSCFYDSENTRVTAKFVIKVLLIVVYWIQNEKFKINFDGAFLLSRTYFLVFDKVHQNNGCSEVQNCLTLWRLKEKLKDEISQLMLLQICKNEPFYFWKNDRYIV